LRTIPLPEAGFPKIALDAPAELFLELSGSLKLRSGIGNCVWARHASTSFVKETAADAGSPHGHGSNSWDRIG